MDNRELQAKSKASKEAVVSAGDRRNDIEFINDTFNLKSAVEHLHSMMKGVTSKEVTAQNVNAACHCVHQLNQTIDTAIKAARFLRE
jgi:3-deoxy-D-manno-octulosonate 8-phosphate phosphatase KdsC-like HAD superfamily phosphatase